MNPSKKLIVIGGPTASGKTKVAIEVAKVLQCPIVSADSRQIFREMNIGTAKPSPNELQVVKHFLINHKSIEETYSVGQYEKEVIEMLHEIFNKNQYAILVGGTGLYIRAVCQGLDDFPHVSENTKNKFTEIYHQYGLSSIQNQLKKLDSTCFNEIDIQNPHRIIRALSVIETSNRPFSFFKNKTKKHRMFTCLLFSLSLDREYLYKRINQRVDQMMDNGLLNEVKSLYRFKNLNALQTVGYTELFEYLDGELTLNQAVDLIKRNSRRYAKRQMTWFRNQGNYKKIDAHETKKAIESILTSVVK